MNRERLKELIRHLETLLEDLKSEVYSDPDSYKPEYQEDRIALTDYDEIFEDDDGYPY